MSATAIVATMLVAGAFHAAWNLVAKQVRTDRILFLVAVGTVTALVLLPWAVTHLPPREDLLPAAGFVLARAAANAVYVVGLGRAYQTLDLSLAYPLVRGVGPVVAVGLAVVLLQERPAAIGVAGLALTSLGIWALALTARRRPADGPGAARAGGRGGAVWVGVTGLTIGCYTVIDKAALEYIHPVTYLCLVELVAVVALGLPIALRGRGRALVRVVRRHPRALLTCGTCVGASYLLALMALRYADASYIAPLREVSVLYGTLLGMVVLGEPHGARRAPAALVIVAGLVLVGVAL